MGLSDLLVIGGFSVSGVLVHWFIYRGLSGFIGLSGLSVYRAYRFIGFDWFLGYIL